jgi:hypothetical protein
MRLGHRPRRRHPHRQKAAVGQSTDDGNPELYVLNSAPTEAAVISRCSAPTSAQPSKNRSTSTPLAYE